jgi:tagatose-1,6-bisphosphate aldolase non-catalytic subunit AgaZ/GatZ
MTEEQAQKVLLVLEAIMDDFPQYWQNHFGHAIEKSNRETSK